MSESSMDHEGHKQEKREVHVTVNYDDKMRQFSLMFLAKQNI